MERIKVSIKNRRVIYFIISIIIMGGIWGYYFTIGISGFSKSNAVTIFSSIIEGMSALLSISIAVFIFRIQSLENRNQQLEESTLNFIFQTTRLAYPKWIPSVEEDIRSKAISRRYYDSRIKGLQSHRAVTNEEVTELHTDENTQQKRLEETLNLHDRTEQTIKRIRNGIFSSVALLVIPILLSFYLLIVSDALDSKSNFLLVSITVLLAVMGIASLMITVSESTVASD